MPEEPKRCVVRQSWQMFFFTRIWFALPFGSAFAVYVKNGREIPILILSLFAASLICVGHHLKGAGDFAKADRVGFSWWSCRLGKKREFVTLKWHRIEACARKNENGRRILRFFIHRPNAPSHTSFPARSSQFSSCDHVDVDFSLSRDPEVNLERAFQSCAEWIAAKRRQTSGGPVVREFVDVPTST